MDLTPKPYGSNSTTLKISANPPVPHHALHVEHVLCTKRSSWKKPSKRGSHGEQRVPTHQETPAMKCLYNNI